MQFLLGIFPKQKNRTCWSRKFGRIFHYDPCQTSFWSKHESFIPMSQISNASRISWIGLVYTEVWLFKTGLPYSLMINFWDCFLQFWPSYIAKWKLYPFVLASKWYVVHLKPITTAWVMIKTKKGVKTVLVPFSFQHFRFYFRMYACIIFADLSIISHLVVIWMICWLDLLSQEVTDLRDPVGPFDLLNLRAIFWGEYSNACFLVYACVNASLWLTCD